MRIRFRASDFGLVAKINIIRAKSKQASCAEMVLGSSFFCSCDSSAVRFLDSENSSQHRLLLRPAPRRVHFARPCTRASTGLDHPSLYAQTLIWPRRDVPRRFTWCFSTKHPSPARELLLCVYSRMMRSHEKRALGVLLSSFSRSEPASTDS